MEGPSTANRMWNTSREDSYLNTCHKWILKRIARTEFVRKAIEEKADLSAFKKPPTFRILFGVFCICISFPMGWPAVTALSGLAIYLEKPFIALLGPVVYALSHLVYILGMYLSGAEYSIIFMRWWLRTVVEFFLDPSELPASRSSPVQEVDTERSI